MQKEGEKKPAQSPTASNSSAGASAKAQTNPNMTKNSTSNESENAFAKKNPFADFSAFEKKIEEMKPLAPGASDLKLMDKLKKQI